MNYLQKQATVKLAQARLAINYVLRNRYMNKRADNSVVDYDDSEIPMPDDLDMYPEIEGDDLFGTSNTPVQEVQPKQNYVPRPMPWEPGFVPAPTATPAPLPPKEPVNVKPSLAALQAARRPMNSLPAMRSPKPRYRDSSPFMNPNYGSNSLVPEAIKQYQNRQYY